MKGRFAVAGPYRDAGCLIAFCILCAASCFAGSVKTVVGPNADFASYKTYQWLPTKLLTKSGIVENDPVFDPIIREAVNRQLTEKGLVEVGQAGDLQVATLALAESIPQIEAVYFPGPAAVDWSTGATTMGRYNREGTLIVNLIDARTNKSAWAGMAKENLGKPGTGQKKVGHAAAAMFKKYPVKK